MIEASVVTLGGEGGQAPGAGGGGGGAVGGGATGGSGGPGGHTYFLDGTPGSAPGAGGGGAGVVGPNAVGGEGGGGGEYICGFFRADELADSIEITIGEGGKAVPGGDGEDGGHTTFGDLLRARGGRGGHAGGIPHQPPKVDPTNGRISAAFFADAADIRDGLLFILGGGWSKCVVPSVPAVIAGCLVAVLEASAEGLPEATELTFELVNPRGFVVAEASVPIPAFDGLRNVIAFRFNAHVAFIGRWHAFVSSREHQLAKIPLDVMIAQPQ